MSKKLDNRVARAKKMTRAERRVVPISERVERITREVAGISLDYEAQLLKKDDEIEALRARLRDIANFRAVGRSDRQVKIDERGSDHKGGLIMHWRRQLQHVRDLAATPVKL